MHNALKTRCVKIFKLVNLKMATRISSSFADWSGDVPPLMDNL